MQSELEPASGLRDIPWRQHDNDWLRNLTVGLREYETDACLKCVCDREQHPCTVLRLRFKDDWVIGKGFSSETPGCLQQPPIGLITKHPN